MTELETQKARLERLESAYDDMLLGNRLNKGDVEGLGNAEFQAVSATTLQTEIIKTKRKIARLQGKPSRMVGTPNVRSSC